MFCFYNYLEVVTNRKIYKELNQFKRCKMSQIYLVGTCHWDLKGPERLKKFLDFVRPSTIFLEASEEQVKRVLEDRRVVKERVGEYERTKEMLNSFLKEKSNELTPDEKVMKFLGILGYETWVPYEYREKNPGIEIYPIHREKVLNRERTNIFREAIEENIIEASGIPTKEFLDEIGSQGLDEFQRMWVDSSYAEFKKLDISKKVESIILLDDAMEPRIREHINQDPMGVIVMPCGGIHFYGDYKSNLYERLQDLAPHRLNLSELDQF